MDTIWDRLAVVVGMKNRKTTQNRQKSNAKKIKNKKMFSYYNIVYVRLLNRKQIAKHPPLKTTREMLLLVVNEYQHI